MSMMNNGIAGMNAASLSLMVTSSNIANASVQGYSRQQAVYTTTATGSVYVSDVKRITDDFYISQVQQSSTALGYSTVYASQAGILEQTLSSDSMSLSPVLNDFFQSLNAAQADPMDPAYRQQILADSGNLAAQFNMLSGKLDDQFGSIDTQMTTMVSEANTLMNQLADLNNEIMKQEAAGGASPHLLDQRDQAVSQLSELVGVDVVYQKNNTVDLFLPNGEPLVVGGNASELVLVPGSPDSSMTQVGLKNGDSTKVLRDVGGAVQAQMDFRDDVLIPARQELDRMALVLVDAINSQLAEGYDLNGDSGSPLFGDINGSDAMRNRSTSSPDNSGSGVLEVEISDSTALTAENYSIVIGKDGTPIVTTEPGGENVEYKMTEDGVISFDGVTISLGEGTLEPGDSFYIEPGKGAAADMEVVMTDIDKLAFSSDPDEPGNNENLLALAGIQDEALVGGSLTINGAYSALVVDVAGKSASAMTDYEASAMIYQNANNNLLSVAGVNMDEEASSLIVFQQAYAANAKVIAAADEMFNLLLGL
ncbi:MAG: flagellar hook-associated protein FlgK [Endozoicomonas sp.]